MSFFSAVKGEVGTESNPLSTTADISNDEFSGFETLFVDFGGQLNTPIEVEMLFGETGGPWIVVSFDWDGGGLNALNNTFVGNTDASNDYDSSGGNRFGRTNNINLGSGSVKGADNFHPTERIPDRGGGLTGNSNNDITEQTASYYNHATNSNFSSLEENALRSFVNKLSSSTPHAGGIVDSDGGSVGLNTQWDSNSFFVPDGGGHAAWIESSGDRALLTPATDNSDEHHSIQLWTHNSYQHFPASGNEAGTPASPNEGLADLNSDLLIPERCRLYTYTGGGPFVATPYSTTLNIGDNFKNNRVFFLVKD